MKKITALSLLCFKPQGLAELSGPYICISKCLDDAVIFQIASFIQFQLAFSSQHEDLVLYIAYSNSYFLCTGCPVCYFLLSRWLNNPDVA